MDSFSDTELLCDLLEVSRKRHVSVHLLLDHLNLNLFLNMWQDLKLNSKDFPVSVSLIITHSPGNHITGKFMFMSLASHALMCTSGGTKDYSKMKPVCYSKLGITHFDIEMKKSSILNTFSLRGL